MAEIRREIGLQNTCFRKAAWTKACERRLEMRERQAGEQAGRLEHRKRSEVKVERR